MIKLALIGGVLGFISISVLEGLEGIIVAGFVLIMIAVVISMLASAEASTARVETQRNHSSKNAASADRLPDNQR